MKRTVWLSVAVGAAVLALGGWVAAPTIDELRRSWEVLQPLSDVERAAVDACEAPGWGGLTKMLEQDLDDGCAPLWFAQSALVELERRPARRIARLVKVAGDPTRPIRARVRAGLSLALQGEPPPVDLAYAVQHPGSGVAVDELVATLAAEPTTPTWLDPWLRRAVAHARATEAGDPSTLVGELRLHAALQGAPAAARRTALVQAALDVLEIDPQAIARARERAAALRPIAHLSPAMQDLARDARCEPLDTPACARRLASMIEGGSVSTDAAPPGAPHPLHDLTRLTAIREGLDGEAARTELEILGAFVDDIQAMPAEERAGRLHAAVFGVGGVQEPDGMLGATSVLDALVSRRPAPWIGAAVAQALGAATQVEVIVGWERGSVVVIVDGRRIWLDACGRRWEPPRAEGEPEIDATPWPPGAVLAQAAADAAGARHRAGQVHEAARLAGYALRLDPVGTEPVRLAFLPAAGSAAAAAGDALAAHAPPAVQQAQASRRARAVDLSAALADEPACQVVTALP